MREESPEVAKLAMVFAKEVLQWHDAVFDSDSNPREIHSEVPVEGKTQFAGFRFGQLDEVMDMALVLCDCHTDTGLVVHRDWEKKYVATIQCETLSPPFIMGKSQPCDTPHEALLQACIHAHRRGFRIRDV